MQDSRSVLQRAGWILVGVGAVDMGYCIYRVSLLIQQGSKAIGYNSPFFIWPLVAGVLLLQNRLTATRVISQMIALVIGQTVVSALLMPFIFPFDLWVISLRLYAGSVLVSFLWSLGALMFEIWIYSQLTSAPVRVAMDEARVNYLSFWRKPSNGLWVGACFALVAFLFVFGFLTKNPTAHKARERAAAEMGNGYKFYVSALRESYNADGHTVQAHVIAYNDKEIKNIPLEWKEK